MPKRCMAALHQRPQLCHVAAYLSENPSPYLREHIFGYLKLECPVPDPFNVKRTMKKLMEFAGGVRCGGKVYAISLQGAMQEIEYPCLEITGMGSIRAVPSSHSRFFKEFLFEMKGEVLLVFLIYHKSLEAVDDVEVFRLDLVRLDWIRVARLRGKTLFLKERRCDWVDSEEYGCRDSCVFFTEGKENKWRVYDMVTCCISSV